jgi:aspartate kinase
MALSAPKAKRERGFEADKVARLVMKFGGTSVADVACIRRVAAHVKREWDAGHDVAVVVSAMAGETNRLVALTAESAVRPDPAEYDTVVAAGEQVTTGLLAMVLQGMGLPARSWASWQLPIRTSPHHSRARIAEIETSGIEAGWAESRQIAVIPGFQGLGPDGRTTTLGRGGSDTSAVGLAAALGARCDIYTDVDGVYTIDPRMVAGARKLGRIAYEEMLELASQGAKVLQTRSVEMAMVHGVPLRVVLSFADPAHPEPGTLVCSEDEIVEKHVVTGIAYSRDEAKITLLGVADEPGVASKIFGTLADANINVDMIVQNISEDGRVTDLTFTVGKADLESAVEALDGIKCRKVVSQTGVAKVSVVGIGMRSHAGVARTMFEALAKVGINIQVISTSEIKISVLIESGETELAVQALHDAYGLETV